jgi:hypothetical protein
MKDIMSVKDKHKGQTAFIVGCGPSLNEYTKEALMDYVKDDVILCIKQAQYEFVKECDYHFVNCNNLVYYEYPEKTEIVASPAINLDFSPFCSKPVSYRFKIKKDRIIEKTVAGLKDFHLNEVTNSEPSSTWGPGIMYEAVIPFAVHCGFSHIKFIGWDYTVNKQDGHLTHFYNHTQRRVFRHAAAPLAKNEAELVIESSEMLYHYLQSKGITSEIISSQSSISDMFPRKCLK